MSVREKTGREHTAVIRKVLARIQTRLDEPIAPRHLAMEAGFSPHHFHRVFRSVVGESIMDHVRRLRLERAAYQLRATRRPIQEIAADAGYGAQEAFTRAMQIHYGIGPTAYRRSRLSYWLPAPCGVHFEPGEAYTSFRKARSGRTEGQPCAAHREAGHAEVNELDLILDWTTGPGASIFASLDRPRSEEHVMAMSIDADEEISRLEREVEEAKQRLTEARRRRPLEAVRDYVFVDWDTQQVRLSELFGDKEDLVVIHNMGTGCVHCTMWADGFTGLAPHLSDRCAFVVVSPDPPEVQKRFASKRNWTFRMLSAKGDSFNADMGFEKDGSPWPGISTFKRDPSGRIFRVGRAFFDVGDDFCATWPILDMLEGGTKDWNPKYAYEK